MKAEPIDGAGIYLSMAGGRKERERGGGLRGIVFDSERLEVERERERGSHYDYVGR